MAFGGWVFAVGYYGSFFLFYAGSGSFRAFKNTYHKKITIAPKLPNLPRGSSPRIFDAITLYPQADRAYASFSQDEFNDYDFNQKN